jgi:hypothetical protein
MRSIRHAVARRNCTIALAVLATDAFLDAPYPFASAACRIEHRFVHIASGTGAGAAGTFASARDRSFAYGRIIRSGLNGSDLFALAATLMFPASFALIVDVAAVPRLDSAWIDAAVGLVLANATDIVAARLRGTAASHALLAPTPALRRFLMYTDVRYSRVPAMALFSATAACRGFARVRELAAAHALRPLGADPVSCADTPAVMRCPADRRSQRADVAAVIPSFKRDYMREIVAGLCEQTHPPARIFIFQNLMHVLLNFTRIFSVASVPVIHVWLTNWNSFFFESYVLMGFVPERFVLKIDDDHIPTDKVSLARFVDAAVRENVMVAPGGLTIDRPLCSLEPQIVGARTIDHLAWVVLFDAQAGKILHRFRPYNIVGAEDISVSVTNAMECDTLMISQPFGVNVLHDDGYGHRKDSEIEVEYSKIKGILLELSYCHYIMAGYRPVTWKNFSIKNPIDIRWPID